MKLSSGLEGIRVRRGFCVVLFSWCVAGGWQSLAAQDAPVSKSHDYYVYVAAESADEVYVVRFDGSSANVVKVIQVGYLPTEIEGPHGLTVSADGRHWFVSMAHGNPFGILYKYATGTDKLVAQVELGYFPATMQISGATGLLYCVNFDLHGDMSPSSVSIVDPDAMVEVARTTTGPMPHGSRLSPDGRFHYSCSMMAGKLYEIDAAKFQVRRTLSLGDEADAGHSLKGRIPAGRRNKDGMKMSKPTWVHPHPKLPRVYVALNGADKVVEVDLETWAVRRQFATGKGPYNAEVAPDGSRLVVSYKSAGEVGLWDIGKGVELARIPSRRKVTHGVVISPDSRYAFVTSEGIGIEKGAMDVLDLRKNRKVCSVDLGLQAGGIAFWKSVPSTR